MKLLNFSFEFYWYLIEFVLEFKRRGESYNFEYWSLVVQIFHWERHWRIWVSDSVTWMLVLDQVHSYDIHWIFLRIIVRNAWSSQYGEFKTMEGMFFKLYSSFYMCDGTFIALERRATWFIKCLLLFLFLLQWSCINLYAGTNHG